jgi:hypothetical protein
MSPIRDQQIGILEIASYLAAAVAVVGTVVWGWDLNLIILLFILVVTYAVLRDLRALWQLKWRNEPSSPSEQTILFQRLSSRSQARRPATVSGGRQNGKNRIHHRNWSEHPDSTRERNDT